jgi:prepilin-type N-terminal cleavage/methylation domain-containing protein
MTFFVRPRSGARGMTLLETLSAMFILAILMTAAVSLYIQGSQHFARTTNDLDAEREARAAMGATTAELRQAMAPRGGLPIAPIISPTTPQPMATEVSFHEVQDIASAVVSGDQLDTSLLKYDRMTIHIDPSATPPANLVEDGIDESTGKALPQRILGREVLSFEVTPQAIDAYDIKIVTAPNVRLDLRDPNNPSLHQYTLTSTVYISYFKGTN